MDGTGDEDLQCPNNEHHTNSNLLLPVQLEGNQLRDGKTKHPGIEEDANRGIGPAKTIYVQTGPLMFSVPIFPIITDRPALEYSGKHKDYPKANVENDSSPEKSPNLRSWKDSQVKEKERKF